MNKIRTGAHILMTLLCCLLIGTGTAFAAGDDTDGTELQVAQPVIMEVQLGTQWAGVEFQLKTDAGLYPGTIHVGQDGVLRMELGGSESYILSCLGSTVAVPSPSSSLDTGTKEQIPNAPDTASDPDTPQDGADHATVAGIPAAHLVLFGGGLLLAVGALAAMHMMRNRKYDEQDPDAFDDDDDSEY